MLENSLVMIHVLICWGLLWKEHVVLAMIIEDDVVVMDEDYGVYTCT